MYTAAATSAPSLPQVDPFRAKVHSMAHHHPHNFLQVDANGRIVYHHISSLQQRMAAQMRGVQAWAQHMTQCEASTHEMRDLKHRGFVGVYQQAPVHPSNIVPLAADGSLVCVGGVLVGCQNDGIPYSVASDTMAMQERGQMNAAHGMRGEIVLPYPVPPPFTAFQGVSVHLNPYAPPLGHWDCDIFIP